MEKYTNTIRKENVKNVESEQPLPKDQKIFEHNTPHSWSNISGFGNIKISTSDNKHYLSEYKHSSYLTNKEQDNK